MLLKQILKAKLVLPPYLGAEARSLLKKVVIITVLIMAFSCEQSYMHHCVSGSF